MDTIYLKIKIKKTNTETDEIRNEGLFFENIAEAIGIDRNHIIEIDENNFVNEIKSIQRKYNDENRSN